MVASMCTACSAESGADRAMGARDASADASDDADAPHAPPSDAPSGSDVSHALDAQDPSDASAPTQPGGWQRASYAFTAARMTENGDAFDEHVQLGFFSLDGTTTYDFCGGVVPSARRVYWEFSRLDRPAGDCDQDSVSPARFDHAENVVVDQCPPDALWTDGIADVHSDCAPHVTAGFGKEATQRVLEGQFIYDESESTLVFRWNVDGACRKEYWTVTARAGLVALALDGEKTADVSSVHRGTGSTDGWAYGSSAAMTDHVPFEAAVTAYKARSFGKREQSFVADTRAPVSSGVLDAQGWTRCGDVYYATSCHTEDAAHPAYLDACEEGVSSAYLKWLSDPFSEDNRFNHVWGWHAFKGDGSCYHKGSHSWPLVQVIDSAGTFRGWLGLEYQESGTSAEQDNYKVFRWIEQGYE